MDGAALALWAGLLGQGGWAMQQGGSKEGPGSETGWETCLNLGLGLGT